MIRQTGGFTSPNRNVTISIGNDTNFPFSRRSMGGVVRTAKRLQKLLCEISVSLVEFVQQLLLQMSPRSLFDRAALGHYALLLCLTLSACSRFHRLRHMADFRPARADVSLFWFRVRIHQNLALEFAIKNNRKRCVPCHNFIHRRFMIRK